MRVYQDVASLLKEAIPVPSQARLGSPWHDSHLYKEEANRELLTRIYNRSLTTVDPSWMAFGAGKKGETGQGAKMLLICEGSQTRARHTGERLVRVRIYIYKSARKAC
jgi:hypothetical protein